MTTPADPAADPDPDPDPEPTRPAKPAPAPAPARPASHTGRARSVILARIRAANTGRASSDVDATYAELSRDYRRAHHDTSIVSLFAERAADYRAVVELVPTADLPGVIARTLVAGRFVVPDGLPPEWLSLVPSSVELLRDTPLPVAELDNVSGVLTGCAVAIAETGTIILDHGPGQGRRALTLVPDFHLVVVRAAQIVPDLPDAFAALDPSRPHTLISGPSATSDIELIRVEGVHGPRNLHVLIAEDS
jgi:L-lactate dehydrogenase complex protein LldG